MAGEQGPETPGKAGGEGVASLPPEKDACPQCGGPMIWVSGGPRCARCGFKESCCF